MTEDERREEPQQPEDEQPEARQPEEEQPEARQPEEEQPEAQQPEPEQHEGAPGEPGEAAPEAEADEPPPEVEERPRPRRRREKRDADEEVIPGAHLEPDLVLEEEREEGEFAEYAGAEAVEEVAPEEEAEQPEHPPEPEPVSREPLDLAADARYRSTGKRKAAVARVTLKPGDGTYQINGRHLDEFFPRIKLQRMARQPLEVAGYGSRMDVAARIHGGGVAAQAGALRHGIARALVEADPNLRVELKRRGYLTRDPRVKERKKAGLKKARKRPQFSKR
jgi:small subunit ribosomal protein S9